METLLSGDRFEMTHERIMNTRAMCRILYDVQIWTVSQTQEFIKPYTVSADWTFWTQQ